MEQAREEIDTLKKTLAIEDDKRKKLEKVMYRSSVVMFQQVDKKLDVERQARMQLENKLEDEKKLRKELEMERTKLVRDLEKGFQADATAERTAGARY